LGITIAEKLLRRGTTEYIYDRCAPTTINNTFSFMDELKLSHLNPVVSKNSCKKTTSGFAKNYEKPPAIFREPSSYRP